MAKKISMRTLGLPRSCPREIPILAPWLAVWGPLRGPVALANHAQ